MLRNLLLATSTFLLATAIPLTAQADDIGGGSFGAGVVLGYPTEGLSVNYFMSNATSIQVDLAVHIGESDWLGIGARADFLWWPGKITSLSFADLVWYWWPGVNVWSWSWKGKGDGDAYIGLGAELPVGIGLQFSGVPIDLNLEAVPVLHIIGSDGINIDFDIGGALTARYYF